LSEKISFLLVSAAAFAASFDDADVKECDREFCLDGVCEPAREMIRERILCLDVRREAEALGEPEGMINFSFRTLGALPAPATRLRSRRTAAMNPLRSSSGATSESPADEPFEGILFASGMAEPRRLPASELRPLLPSATAELRRLSAGSAEFLRLFIRLVSCMPPSFNLKTSRIQ
jgi:hypothetical protein